MSIFTSTRARKKGAPPYEDDRCRTSHDGTINRSGQMVDGAKRAHPHSVRDREGQLGMDRRYGYDVPSHDCPVHEVFHRKSERGNVDPIDCRQPHFRDYRHGDERHGAGYILAEACRAFHLLRLAADLENQLRPGEFGAWNDEYDSVVPYSRRYWPVGVRHPVPILMGDAAGYCFIDIQLRRHRRRHRVLVAQPSTNQHAGSGADDGRHFPVPRIGGNEPSPHPSAVVLLSTAIHLRRRRDEHRFSSGMDEGRPCRLYRVGWLRLSYVRHDQQAREVANERLTSMQ